MQNLARQLTDRIAIAGLNGSRQNVPPGLVLTSATQDAFLILTEDSGEDFLTLPIVIGERPFEPCPGIDKSTLVAPSPKQAAG